MKKTWWKEAVVYQIYPRSFQDTNGDGIGDFNGIRQHLDYLKNLGINTIWISPMFASPQDDNGYDISDYRAVNPEYGSMEEFQALIQEAHERNIKVLLDLVVNHTSDEHVWFQESKKSKDNPYRDYYIWRDGKNGGPPSDWGSHFSGSAWEYDENTDQYYLHLFSKKQPDLNWENPKVRQEVYDIMRFWCDLGVDGYRIDTVCMYSKNLEFPDTGEMHKLAVEHFNDGPRMHDYLQEMHKEVFSRYDTMTVGEANNIPIENAALYVGEDRNELNMLFHFDHVSLKGKGADWTDEPTDPRDIKKALSRWQVELDARGGWNTLYFSNHDQPRHVSKFGDDEKYWKESAKMIATIIHTQKGTPFVYQGEELGMTNCPFEEEEYRDVEAINELKYAREHKLDDKAVLHGLKHAGRDNSRTPMQWNDRKNAGFSTGKTWIKVNPNYMTINAQLEEHDPDSVLAYYRALIRLRKENPVLVYGKFEEFNPEHPQVYAYTRTLADKTVYVIINMTGEAATFAYPTSWEMKHAKHLLGNYRLESSENNQITLRPYESHILIHG